ncbi:MAG: hypothetical protein A2046_00350 [Bacteroidetes bacterium GWA2_30_7]|nr:MAG: hypothetical protein A2046_00350 [Bacteroidetes bacterium GWA2_30_7]
MIKNIRIYKEKLAELKSIYAIRELKNLPENIINFSSNDYLSLNSDVELRKEFLSNNRIEEICFSSTSSRLLTGNHHSYILLEEELSKLYNNKTILVFNSGYHLNVGILPSICQKDDLIISDKFIHASIIDGIRLCRCAHYSFEHNNYNQLEDLLKENRHKFNNVFIVTESIFSMDGDITDLKSIVEIKNKFGCFLYVDEAHAFGVRGNKGLGCGEEQNVINDIDFIVATFGKALASIGAFIVCDKIFKDYFINHTRTLIYSTALPPINVEWTRFLIAKLPEMSIRRNDLKNSSNTMKSELITTIGTHIIPYIIGENKTLIRISNELINNGFYVLPIRYPTVPKGQERFRFSMCSNHKSEEIKNMINLLKTLQINEK